MLIQAMLYLRLDPEMVKEQLTTKIGPIKWKRSTLHEIVRMDPPKALVQEIIRVYPEVLNTRVSTVVILIYLYTGIHINMFSRLSVTY